jgi:enamine deaminase RidA (YjgF/YER057c/UK114 family)
MPSSSRRWDKQVPRQRTGSASPYEAEIGFSRAIRAGDRILVSGTAPVEPDGSSTPGDAEAQARRCFAIILAAIEQLGGSAADVVRTRMFITDPADAEAVGRAHGTVFREIRPAATMVVIAALLRPEWKVEIEAEAIIGTSA